MPLKRGFLIVFEGIDGAGKTTQANLLSDSLKRKGFDIVLSKEPTDSIFGRKIKRLAQEGRDSTKPMDEYRLFINDRKVHVKNLIRPALAQKKIVVLDRYYFSNIAYQSAIGLDPEKIRLENQSFAPTPEIVFLIDIAPRVGLRRIQKGRNENPNFFEGEKNLTKVREEFLKMKDNYIVTIDGIGEIRDIHVKMMNVIEVILDHYLKKAEQYNLFNSNGSERITA